MKNLLMSSAIAVSSLLAITACANTSAATDTKPSSAMQNQNNMMQMQNRSGGMGANSPLSQLNLSTSQQTQIQSIMQNNRGEPMQNHNAVLEILTPEQRTQLNQLMADRMKSGQQGPGMRRK